MIADKFGAEDKKIEWKYYKIRSWEQIEGILSVQDEKLRAKVNRIRVVVLSCI